MLQPVNFWIVQSIVLVLEFQISVATTSNVADIELSSLHKYLSDSHHIPLCVLIRKTASALERNLATLWTNHSDVAFSSWRLAAVNTSKMTSFPRYLMAETEQLPLLRCFLGQTLPFDFQMPKQHIFKHLHQWLKGLHKNFYLIQNADLNMIRTSVSSHHFTFVIFPTVLQHAELEDEAFKVGDRISQETSVSLIVIHPSSPNLRELSLEYNIFSFPSVLVIEQGTDREAEQHTIFNIHEVLTNKLETHLRARLISAKHFTTGDFQTKVLEVTATEEYHPQIIGFYAWWEPNVGAFLSFLRHAIDEFRMMDANLRFGLIDLSTNPLIVSEYLTSDCLQHLPFIGLFQRVKGIDSVHRTDLFLARPSAFTLYKALQETGLILTNSRGEIITYFPYGYTRPSELCQEWEGPQGHMCSAYIQNATEGWLHDFGASNFHNDQFSSVIVNATSEVHSVLEEMHGISEMTADHWHGVLSSHLGSNNSLVQAEVKVTVLIFIIQSCRSCEQNMATFDGLHQHLYRNESFSVYLVNCSHDDSLCATYHISGFPTIVAFRTYSSSPVNRSCTLTSDPETVTVRQDYFGPLTVTLLLDWVKLVSRNAVTNLKFTKSDLFEKETSHLIATVLPRDSQYLPLPPRKNKKYFYSLACFQLACERLFGLARCYIIYSTDVPPAEFGGKNLQLIVIQVLFRRRDGVAVPIMQLGKSLQDFLDTETSDVVHLFHPAHNYHLRPKQKCEENHDHCTKFLEAFTRDHLRLPVIEVTPETFHTRNNPLLGEELPVLLALAEPENLTTDSGFFQILDQVAHTLYKEVIVATLNVKQYLTWADNFIPFGYSKLGFERWRVYPRFCMFFWKDHTKAAFYPLLDMSQTLSSTHILPVYSDDQEKNILSKTSIINFVKNTIANPDKHFIKTVQF